MNKTSRITHIYFMYYFALSLMPFIVFQISALFTSATITPTAIAIPLTRETTFSYYGAVLRFTACYSMLVLGAISAILYYIRLIFASSEGPNGPMMWRVRLATIICTLSGIGFIFLPGSWWNPLRENGLSAMLKMSSKTPDTKIDFMFDTIDGIAITVLLLTAIIVGALVASHKPTKITEGADTRELGEIITWGTAIEKMDMIRQVLLITSVVAVLVVITIQARLAITESLIPLKVGVEINPKLTEFQSASTAIGFAWAVVLSSTIAAIYLPTAIRLAPDYEAQIDKTVGKQPALERFIGDALRALAIIAPAIVKGLIELAK